MDYSNALLDAYKERFGIPSDYALAQRWRISQNSIRSMRLTGVSEERALHIATETGKPEGEVMALLRAERAKSPEVKAAWKKVAESVRSALGLAAFVVITLVPSTPPRLAQAAESAFDAVYIMRVYGARPHANSLRVALFPPVWQGIAAPAKTPGNRQPGTRAVSHGLNNPKCARGSITG